MRVCWIGNHRYSQPLNPTDEKKWRLLSGLGIQITVIAFNDGLRPRRFTQHGCFYLLPELPFAVLRYGEIFLCGLVLLLWLILRRDVRVIIAQSPFEGAIGALAKQMVGLIGKHVKLVIESHGDFEVSLFKQKRITVGNLYRYLMNASARYAFHHADVLRAVSSTTRLQLQRWAPDKPLEQFMAWTDFGVFQQTVREKLPAQTDDVIYAGVLTPLKAVHVLIEAFAGLENEFPQMSLYLAGKAQDRDYAARLEHLIASLGLGEKVQFLGAIQQSKLARQIASARVLVLPSSSEGLPRVLIEAMLVGTPVIATRVGGIPDIVQEGINGYLIPPNDVEALTERLREVMTDSEVNAMGERAREFAAKFFSESAYVEGYRRLIEVTARSSVKDIS